jgi:hypothetical protein
MTAAMGKGGVADGVTYNFQISRMNWQSFASFTFSNGSVHPSSFFRSKYQPTTPWPAP